MYLDIPSRIKLANRHYYIVYIVLIYIEITLKDTKLPVQEEISVASIKYSPNSLKKP